MLNKSLFSILSLTLLVNSSISEANNNISQKKSDSSFTSTLTGSSFKRTDGQGAIDEVSSNFIDIKTSCLSGFSTSSGSNEYISATRELAAFKSRGSVVKSKIKSESQLPSQSCFKSEATQLACPSGYTGLVSRLNRYEAVGQSVSLISSVVTSNSCSKTESQSLACGYGLSGSIYQQRQVSLNSSLSPIYGGWVSKNVSCSGIETYQASCPSGMVGSITYQRSKWLDSNLALRYGSSYEVSRSCTLAERNILASNVPTAVVASNNLLQSACWSTNPDWTENCYSFAVNSFKNGQYFARLWADFEPQACMSYDTNLCGNYENGPLWNRNYQRPYYVIACLVWSNVSNTVVNC